MKKTVFLILASLWISRGAIYKAEDQAGSVVLTTSALKLEIKKTAFQLTVSDLSGKVLTSQATAMAGAVASHASAGTEPIVKRDPPRYHAEADALITGETHKFNCGGITVSITFRNPHVFSVFMHNAGTSGPTKESFVSSPDEHFWGLGETWDVKSLDMKGKTLKMANRGGTPDQGGYIPFYISSRGYGILIDNHLSVSFTFGASNTTISIPSIPGSVDGAGYVTGASTNWYFYYGPDLLDVIDRYTEHVSRPALPPPWAVFSTWQWRDANSEGGARTDVEGMQEAGIPLSLVWMDRPWATGGQGMPPPFKWNGSYSGGAKMTQDFNAKGVKVGVWVAENGYVGAYNSKTWMNEGHVNKLKGDITPWLAESSVQMYKIDRGNMQNFAPYFTIQAYWEAWHSVYGDDFVTLPRVVSHYGQKYVSGKWPGDNAKSLGYGSGGMSANIPALLNFGIAGFPHWGSDTGGFPDVSGNDVTTRWAQFSSMCPIFQTCGRPYAFGGNTAIYKKYAMLYTSLFPYRWTYTVIAHRKGHPTNRAMALHYPDDPKGYNQDGEMFLGYWLLAAPMNKVSGSRDVYLPEGEWIDWWTGERHPGKTTITKEAPLDVMPLYMKAGAIIPMIEVTDTKNQNYLNSNMNPLIVRVCPKGNTSFSMAGDKRVYKKQTKPYTNLDSAVFTSSEKPNGVVITANGADTTQYQFEVYTDKTIAGVFHNGAPLEKAASGTAAKGWSQEAGKPVIVKLPAGAANNVVGLSTDGKPLGVHQNPVRAEISNLRHDQLTGKLDFSIYLAENASVSLAIYRLNGHKVKTLLNRSLKAGLHNMESNTADLAPGSYYANLKAGRHVKKQKLVVLK